MKTQVIIIGFGTMGKAIARAISGKDRRIAVFGIDKNKPKISEFIQKVNKADFIILSVKPQDAEKAIGEIKNCLYKKTILISIMAGISIQKLGHLSGHRKIIRLMPNLGLAVGQGIAAWKKTGLSGKETQEAKNFMNKICDNFEVKNENTINKITAISGSGPAYFFLLADSLMKASDHLGLNKNESRKLVARTFLSSALLGQTDDYASLIKKIASKGGTTESALQIFRKENFNEIVLAAVKAAYKRVQELNHG